MRHLRRRLGETLAITSLYLGIPHPHSRSSLCAFRRSLRGHGRVPPWGSTRAAPILARPSTPASAPSSTYDNYPRRGLEPAARNPHPQQGLPATDAAPLSSIRRVGAGSEDPCAICPEICGVTRPEPYVATRRGGGRLAEGSSSHSSRGVCTAQCGFFIYIDVGHEARRAGRYGLRPDGSQRSIGLDAMCITRIAFLTGTTIYRNGRVDRPVMACQEKKAKSATAVQ